MNSHKSSENLVSDLLEQSTNMLNLTVLQRIDPYIDQILLNAGHVGIYHYNIDLTQMSRTDVDGSLFVVKRNAQPRFQFIVMNRRNTENLVVDLLDNFEYEVRHPYLLYRNDATQEVNGLLFYNSRECDEVANLFSSFGSRILRASGMNLTKRHRRKRKRKKRISDKEKVKSPLKDGIEGVNYRESKLDYQNVKESPMNVGYDASSTAMPGQLLQASASAVSTSSRPFSLIPSQSPIMKFPSLPMSTPSAPNYQTMKEFAINIGGYASSTGMSGQLQQASASSVPTSSHPPSVIPSQSPIIEVPSLPISTPSASHHQNVNEFAMNIGCNASSTGIYEQIQQASASAVPTSSYPPSVNPLQSPIMKAPSLPMSTPASHDQNVKESAMNIGCNASSTEIYGQIQQASASAVPTSSYPPSVNPLQSPIMEVPSLPKSTPASHDQNVKESAMNIGSNASSTGISGQSQQGSASAAPTSSHPPGVIPSQSPIMKVLSLPMSTPSVPHDQNVEESIMNIGSNASSTGISGQLQQASESAVPTSSHPPIVIPSQSPIMKVQSVSMSPPSGKRGQNVKESAMNIGCNPSSTGMSGHPHQASALAVPTSSHPPCVIPLQSPVVKLPSLPMSTPSAPHDQIVKESAMNIGCNASSPGMSGQLLQASASAVPTSSHPPCVFPLQSRIMKVPSLPMSTPSAPHDQNVEESAINIGYNAFSTGMSGQLYQASAWSTSSHPPSVIPSQSPIMKVPSLPMSTPSAPHDQNVNESAVNIGYNASSTGLSGQLQQDSASAVPTSSHTPSVIPMQSPIMKAPSFPISTPSAPPFPHHDASEAILSNRDHVMPSSLFVPTSSPTVLAPPILSTLPTPAHPPLAMQHFFGAPLLQTFKPAPSLTPNPTPPSYIALTKQNVQEALVTLVQDSRFIDMVFQALLQKAHQS